MLELQISINEAAKNYSDLICVSDNKNCAVSKFHAAQGKFGKKEMIPDAEIWPHTRLQPNQTPKPYPM